MGKALEAVLLTKSSRERCGSGLPPYVIFRMSGWEDLDPSAVEP